MIRRRVALQPRWDIFLLAVFHMAEPHRTLAVVDPERALFVQVHLVVAKEILHQQALQTGIDFYIVVVIHRVDITATVIDRSLKLE